MDLQEYFCDILGVGKPADSVAHDSRLPPALNKLYNLNACLPESILATDVRILESDKIYCVDKYTVFAEESQCVVLWAFIDNFNDSNCYKLCKTDPVLAFSEDRDVKDTLLGLVINNSLSSGIFKYYKYETLPLESLRTILDAFQCITEVSELKVIVIDGVACTLQISDCIFVSAASRSDEKLQRFLQQLNSLSRAKSRPDK